MQSQSLRDVHVHYSVRGPNSCFKRRKTRTILSDTLRRSSLCRYVGEKNFFVSSFRVRSSVELYAVAKP